VWCDKKNLRCHPYRTLVVSCAPLPILYVAPLIAHAVVVPLIAYTMCHAPCRLCHGCTPYCPHCTLHPLSPILSVVPLSPMSCVALRITCTVGCAPVAYVMCCAPHYLYCRLCPHRLCCALHLLSPMLWVVPPLPVSCVVPLTCAMIMPIPSVAPVSRTTCCPHRMSRHLSGVPSVVLPVAHSYHVWDSVCRTW